MDRQSAILQLLNSFHLDVEDRKQFVELPVKLDEALSAVTDALEKYGRFPTTWHEQEPYDGVLLEAEKGRIKATRKAEVGMACYKVMSQQNFQSPMDAAGFALKAMYSKSIDGVPVGW
jgi:hypothetical protein